MENATKALVMAGGVLIAILIIGLLVFFFNNVSSYRKVEDDAEALKQAVDFNKKYEVYNKNNIYGSELLSLANMIVDYNKKENEEKDYKKMNLEVIIKNSNDIFKAKYTEAEELSKDYDKLESSIADMNKEYQGKSLGKKTLAYWASCSRKVLTNNFDSSTNPTYEKIKNLIDKYGNLVTKLDDISRATFKCTNVEYDEYTGRIVKFVFEEK